MSDIVTRQKRINDLELAIRTIEDLLPEMPTEAVEKWYSIGVTFLARIENEMKSTCQHTCRICFFKEFGYRNELPPGWYRKGRAEICFQHEYEAAAKLLKDAGHEDDAFMPTDEPRLSTQAMKHAMDALPAAKSEAESALEELMSL